MKHYDLLISGPISLDRNIDCDGAEQREIGGAVIASGYAAANSGSHTAVFTKFNPNDVSPEDLFRDVAVDFYWTQSPGTTSIENRYFTPDKERRACTALSRSTPFVQEQFPDIEAEIYHFAGLIHGDFTGELFEQFSSRGRVAVDVQCLLRREQSDKSMAFFDWEEKKRYLPFIDFLKTDAAEAKILTGLDDRAKAAMLLHKWGAKEVMITHNTEVIIYDGANLHTCPIKARNLSGRTGRGDTCFAAYLSERLRASVSQSLLYATALVSLKMETPGPFRQPRTAVEDYIQRFYI